MVSVGGLTVPTANESHVKVNVSVRELFLFISLFVFVFFYLSDNPDGSSSLAFL